MKAYISLTLLFFLTACSSKQTYDAIKHNQCLEKTGQVYCDEMEDYESYQQKREELLKESSK